MITKGPGQARSQDLEKGGLFWNSEKFANDLDPNFHCSWISFTRFVRKLIRNFSESSKIQTYFPPKIRWSPKKKGLHQFWDWFFGRNRKFKRFFFAQNQVVSKKKKKRSSPVLRLIFPPKSESQTFFPPKIRWSPKKKKKNRSSPILRLIFRPNRKFKRLSGAVFLWGGYFQFFTKNRPQNHQKGAILHTSQANEGVEPPPPPLATLLVPGQGPLNSNF